MQEVLINMLATSFATLGKAKFIEVLQQLYVKDPHKYKLALQGLHTGITALQPLVDKTKTPIDDAVLLALAEAIEVSAKNNGVEL